MISVAEPDLKVMTGSAKKLTWPLTFTVCEVSDVFASPLVPVPSEVSDIVAVPFLLPALEVLMPTARLVLLVDPAASRLNEPPLVVTPPVALPILASSFSENPSFETLFVMLRDCDGAVSPTWTIPKFTGSGVCTLGEANL